MDAPLNMRSKLEAWLWLLICVVGLGLVLWGFLFYDDAVPAPVAIGVTLSMFILGSVGQQAVVYLIEARRQSRTVHFDGLPPGQKLH